LVIGSSIQATHLGFSNIIVAEASLSQKWHIVIKLEIMAKVSSCLTAQTKTSSMEDPSFPIFGFLNKN